MRGIIARIADEHGFTANDLVGTSTSRKIAYARFAAIREIKAVMGFSDIHIGRIFNRDRTTIIHALGRRKHVLPSDMKGTKAA